MSSFTLSGGSGSEPSHRTSMKRSSSVSSLLDDLEQLQKRIKRFQSDQTIYQSLSDDPDKSHPLTPNNTPREIALLYTDELSTLRNHIEKMQSETMHNSTDDPVLFAETMYAYYGQQFEHMLEAIEKMQTKSSLRVARTEVTTILKTFKIREAVEELAGNVGITLTKAVEDVWIRVSDDVDLIGMTVIEAEKELDEDPNPLQNFEDKIRKNYITVLRDAMRQEFDKQLQELLAEYLPDQS